MTAADVVEGTVIRDLDGIMHGSVHVENPARPGWCAVCGCAYPCPYKARYDNPELLTGLPTPAEVVVAP